MPAEPADFEAVIHLEERLDALVKNAPRKQREELAAWVSIVKEDLPEPSEGFLLQEVYEDRWYKNPMRHGSTIGTLLNDEVDKVQDASGHDEVTPYFLFLRHKEMKHLLDSARASHGVPGAPKKRFPKRETRLLAVGHGRQLTSHRQQCIYGVTEEELWGRWGS